MAKQMPEAYGKAPGICLFQQFGGKAPFESAPAKLAAYSRLPRNCSRNMNMLTKSR